LRVGPRIIARRYSYASSRTLDRISCSSATRTPWSESDTAVLGMILDGLGELFDNLRLDFPHLRGALTLVLDTVADPESGLDAPLEDPFAELVCAVAH
jgi:hypothetical protein